MKRLLFAFAVLAALVLYVLATQDILVESFEANPGYDTAGWSESVGAGSIVDEDSTEHTFSGHGSQCLKLAKVSPNFNAFVYHTFAVPPADSWTEIHFHIESETMSAGNQANVLVLSDVDWHNIIYCFIQKEAAGGLTFHSATYYDGGAHSGTFQNISAGVDYRIRARYDTTNTEVEIFLDATSVLAASPTTMGGGPKYISFGDAGNSSPVVFYVDGLAMSSTGWAAPEIAITGVADGGTYDFGSKAVGTDTDYTFTISNSGEDTLNLSGSPIVSITGANADQFSVQSQPDATVAADGSTTFIIRFSPTSAGAKTAAVAIVNDDADENPYNLTLTGTGVAAATRRPIILLFMNGHR